MTGSLSVEVHVCEHWLHLASCKTSLWTQTSTELPFITDAECSTVWINQSAQGVAAQGV